MHSDRGSPSACAPGGPPSPTAEGSSPSWERPEQGHRVWVADFVAADPGLPQPSRGDQDGLEAHDERATLIVDGRSDGFEQAFSDLWFEGGVVAP
jgi:hypothetical protein